MSDIHETCPDHLLHYVAEYFNWHFQKESDWNVKEFELRHPDFEETDRFSFVIAEHVDCWRLKIMYHSKLREGIKVEVFTEDVQDLKDLAYILASFRTHYKFSYLQCKFIHTDSYDVVTMGLQALDKIIGQNRIDKCYVCLNSTLLKTSCKHNLCNLCRSSWKDECPACKAVLTSPARNRNVLWSVGPTPITQRTLNNEFET